MEQKSNSLEGYTSQCITTEDLSLKDDQSKMINESSENRKQIQNLDFIWRRR